MSSIQFIASSFATDHYGIQCVDFEFGRPLNFPFGSNTLSKTFSGTD